MISPPAVGDGRSRCPRIAFGGHCCLPFVRPGGSRAHPAPSQCVQQPHPACPRRAARPWPRRGGGTRPARRLVARNRAAARTTAHRGADAEDGDSRGGMDSAHLPHRPSGAGGRPRTLLPGLGDSRGRRAVGRHRPAGRRGNGRRRRVGLRAVPGPSGSQERAVPRRDRRRRARGGHARGGALRRGNPRTTQAGRGTHGRRPPASPPLPRPEHPANRLGRGLHTGCPAQAEGGGLAARCAGHTARR